MWTNGTCTRAADAASLPVMHILQFARLMMAIKAVLFDLDGTLVDSNDLHVQAWQRALGDAGHDVDAPTIHAQIGKGSDMFVPALLPDADDATIETLGDAHGDVYKSDFIASVQPFPHARDLMLRVQRAGQRVVLATSASAEELDHYLDLLDARGIVTATTGADDVEHTKPAPDIFATALKKVAPLGPDEVIVVGDTPYDIEAAAGCGIAAIGLRSGGFPDERLHEAGAVALYDDVAALLADYDASPLGRTA